MALPSVPRRLIILCALLFPGPSLNAKGGQARIAGGTVPPFDRPCAKKCENMTLPRSFDITDVSYRSLGKDARHGIVMLNVAPRESVSVDRLDVTVYLLDDQGHPLGFAGRSDLPASKWSNLEIHPAIGSVGCPRSLLGRFLVLLKWKSQTAYEGHYVQFEHKRPQAPCPAPLDELEAVTK